MHVLGFQLVISGNPLDYVRTKSRDGLHEICIIPQYPTAGQLQNNWFSKHFIPSWRLYMHANAPSYNPWVPTRAVYLYPQNDTIHITIEVNRYDMYHDTYRFDSIPWISRKPVIPSHFISWKKNSFQTAGNVFCQIWLGWGWSLAYDNFMNI